MVKPSYSRVHVIINPAAGHNEPILNTLNDVFNTAEIDWEISLTHQAGDATRFTREAVESGVDLIAGYGGDGTQMEVVNGVRDSGVPIAILPGGTGNAMAFELGIPRNLRKAAELIIRSDKRRSVDLARVGEQYFMLRAYTGLDPEKAASREMKDRYGLLAYPAASLRFLSDPPLAHYQISVDG